MSLYTCEGYYTKHGGMGRLCLPTLWGVHGNFWSERKATWWEDMRIIIIRQGGDTKEGDKWSPSSVSNNSTPIMYCISVNNILDGLSSYTNILKGCAQANCKCWLL